MSSNQKTSSADSLSRRETAPPPPRPSIGIAQLTRAFTEIARTRKLLEGLPRPHHPELVAAFSEYQPLLQQFKSELPRLRGWLLAERARLASRQSHSSGVDNWLQTNRQTR